MLDMDCGKLKKNAYRVTKHRGITSSRVRVPGGHLTADVLGKIQEIAETYGNGQVHLTIRQGFEILGIPFEKVPEVNKALQPIIEELDINQEAPGTGYPASGTRNIMACVGNRVCPFGNYDTTALAKRIEKAIFPNDLHVKVALTGCPNDCCKVRMHDFGIIGMTEPQFDPSRCISLCEEMQTAFCGSPPYGQIPPGAERRKMHRLRSLCPCLPQPGLDPEQDPVFPDHPLGPQWQEESPDGRGLHQMGGCGQCGKDCQQCV